MIFSFWEIMMLVLVAWIALFSIIERICKCIEQRSLYKAIEALCEDGANPEELARKTKSLAEQFEKGELR